jgi:hypothetical protein
MHPVCTNDDVELALRAVAKPDMHAAFVLLDCPHFDSKPNLYRRGTAQQLMKDRAGDAKMEALRPPYWSNLLFGEQPACGIKTDS